MSGKRPQRGRASGKKASPPTRRASASRSASTASRRRQSSHAHTARSQSRRPSAPATRRPAGRAGQRRRKQRLSPLGLAPLVLLAAIVTVVISLRMTMCAPAEGIVAERVEPQGVSMAVSDRTNLYKSPLDWSGLSTDANGYLAYQQNGAIVSKLGIDVSEHNAEVDWEKVKSAGIEFAYIRVGYRGSQAGNIVEDSTFAQNFAGARAAGLKVGVYFFSEAISDAEAREEAEFIVEKLDGATLDYPIAFDMEPEKNGGDRIEGLTTDEMTSIASAFCRTCTNNGYNAVVYGNQYDLTHYNLATLMEYGFWYAEYTSQPSMNLSFGMWQFTSKGTVPGVEGTCDLNLDLTDAIAATA